MQSSVLIKSTSQTPQPSSGWPALKVLYMLGEVNNIRNGEMQGGIMAARQTTYMINEAMLRYSRRIPKEMVVTHIRP